MCTAHQLEATVRHRSLLPGHARHSMAMTRRRPFGAAPPLVYTVLALLLSGIVTYSVITLIVCHDVLTLCSKR